ncbi:MAG: ABC transporter permease subunit [Pseudomonadota bacterium]
MSARTRFLSRSNRSLLIQLGFLAGVIILVWGAIRSAQVNLAELGITSGFAFLDRGTGWSYSFSLIERSIDDTYRRTLLIGFANTLFLGVITIILSTVLGLIMGTMRDARNLAARSVATVYVQIFRNIPLILQVIFWYAALIHMPGPRQALSMMDMIFVSNRGVMIPVLNAPLWVAVVQVGFAILLALILASVKTMSVARRFFIWLLAVLIFGAVLAFSILPADASLLSVPELKGLRFVGGLTVSIELVAMIIAIVLYSGAYIAEVVRGGLLEVPKGLVEAGKALGLGPRSIWFRIKMPMALRTIIPPLGNQWIFTMKATTVGVAIGFSDLFMIVSTSITQSGQTLELIGIMMLAFLAINFTIAQAVNVANKRMQLKGH